jgi:thiosulfate/3-mercaptopyruvate sulfurtransferase
VLTSPSDLAQMLGEVAVLDVRWQLGRTDGHEDYLAGHVPGAAYVDLTTDLANPPGARGRHPLPDPQRFASAMRRCGVRNDRAVVVYDANASTSATRAWWLLRHHGHPDVRVLDGGWPAWLRAGGPVEAGAPPLPEGDFRGSPGRLPVVDADGAAELAEHGRLLDARAPERFRGETEPVDPVAGHIPGALNVPTAANLHEDGTFRPLAELASVYEAAGALGERPVGVYCGSGVTATHDVFVLDLLGRSAALYPGSWSEWVGGLGRSAHKGA